jgi:hypothetical protein
MYARPCARAGIMVLLLAPNADHREGFRTGDM